MSAEKPQNWRAMCDAWDNPEEFARQCHLYYSQQLRADGHVDITEPRRKVDA